MQHDAAEDLHGEVGLVEHAARGLTADGERIGENVVERFPVREAVFEHLGLSAQLVLGHGLIFRREGKHLVAQRLNALELALGVVAEEFGQNICHTFYHLSICGARRPANPEPCPFIHTGFSIPY